jgi:hypothetical protein
LLLNLSVTLRLVTAYVALPQFKENFGKLVEEAVKTRDPEDRRPVLVMAQDEGCFGRINTPSRAWVPKPLRPFIPRQIVREYTYVYAAVAPSTGQMTSLILPFADTAMMNVFLQHVSRTFSDHFLVIQVDQAGWHNSQDLVLPENIRLIPQPAYSPELNPVEHIWDEIREKAFHNRLFSSFDAVIEALCRKLQQLEENTQLIHSMTYFPHFRMAS